MQALLSGNSHTPWIGADLDIYCTSFAAPFVRTWLTGQREVNQVYCGISQVFYPFQSYPSSIIDNDVDNDPVSHVEYYSNKLMDKPRLAQEQRRGESRLRSYVFPGSGIVVSLLTSKGEGVPFQLPVRQDQDEGKVTKKNIDLVVLKVCINSYLMFMYVHLYPLNGISSALRSLEETYTKHWRCLISRYAKPVSMVSVGLFLIHSVLSPGVLSSRLLLKMRLLVNISKTS